MTEQFFKLVTSFVKSVTKKKCKLCYGNLERVMLSFLYGEDVVQFTGKGGVTGRNSWAATQLPNLETANRRIFGMCCRVVRVKSVTIIFKLKFVREKFFLKRTRMVMHIRNVKYMKFYATFNESKF